MSSAHDARRARKQVGPQAFPQRRTKETTQVINPKCAGRANWYLLCFIGGTWDRFRIEGLILMLTQGSTVAQDSPRRARTDINYFVSIDIATPISGTLPK